LVTLGILLRRVRAFAAAEPTAFVWIYPKSLAGSGYPASRGQVAWLDRHGIDSILSLTEDPLPDSWLTPSMNYMHIPMRDHEPPEQLSLSAAAERIETELGSGRTVLVHCQAGKGRTMCAIAAYLIRSKGMGATEAIAILRGLRAGAVERRQEESLQRFASSLAGANSGRDP